MPDIYCLLFQKEKDKNSQLKESDSENMQLESGVCISHSGMENSLLTVK